MTTTAIEAIGRGVLRAVQLGLVALALLIGASYLGAVVPPLALLSHLRIQYLLAALLGATVLAVARRPRWVAAALVVAGLQGMAIVPWYLPAGSVTDAERTLERQTSDRRTPGRPVRLLYANVLAQSTGYAEMARWVRAEQPDVIALVEPNAAWLAALDLAAAGWPAAVEVPRDDNFGIALYARGALANDEVVWLSGDKPAIAARVRLPGADGDVGLSVVVSHPVPPQMGSALRDRQLVEVAALLEARPPPRVLVGDLNVTPWAPPYQRLVRQTGLRNARRGYGVQPTWPLPAPWGLRIPIDHVLVGPGVLIRDHRVGPAFGSDHLPLVVDLVVDR